MRKFTNHIDGAEPNRRDESWCSVIILYGIYCMPLLRVIIWINGVKGTSTSAIFVSFLEEFILNINQETILENQNISCDEITPLITKVRLWNSFWNRREILMIAITPYSPWLNPVEKFILAVKRKLGIIKAKESKSTNQKSMIYRWMSLLQFQKWFDYITKTDCRKFIERSRDK